jgi:cell division protein FtsL
VVQQGGQQPTQVDAEGFTLEDRECLKLHDRVTCIKQNLLYPLQTEVSQLNGKVAGDELRTNVLSSQVANNTERIAAVDKKVGDTNRRVDNLNTRVNRLSQQDRSTRSTRQGGQTYRGPIPVHGHATLTEKQWERFEHPLRK